MPGPRASIDFESVARAALAASERLVPQWLPGGKQSGHEYQCADLTGGAGSSCSVNLNTGRWADFATDERGNDLISLYAAISGLKQGEAAREVAAQLGMDTPARGKTGTGGAQPSAASKAKEKPPAPPEEDESVWVDAGPWPPDGPPPPRAHTYRGIPKARWTYLDAAGRTLGFVCRFVNSSGGKEIIPLVWKRNKKTGGCDWRWLQFDAKRPLYGLYTLAQHPTRPVLVVEGEKCAEAAQAVLEGSHVVVAWPGGGKAVRKADWSVLAGRTIVVWPDCDAKRDKTTRALLPAEKQPGMAAARAVLEIIGALPGTPVPWLVDIPAPGDVADGYDVADLIDDHPTAPASAVQKWLHSARLAAPPAPPAPPPPLEAARADDGGDDRWQDRLVHKRGELVPNLANVALILRHHQRWRGVVAFDEFNYRTIKLEPPPYAHGRVGEWEGDDDSRTVEWLTHATGLSVGTALVTEAIEMLAKERRIHPVRDWLRTLEWDGVPRLRSWLVAAAGAPDTEYTRLVGEFFLRGMVKRVLEPGVKFDYCLVLEGHQGIGKSSLARVLGGEWYSDADLDLQHKDSMAMLAGKWLHEFSELDSLARTEASRHKSFLSRQFDEYRPVYARRVIKAPRQVAFLGTTNEDEYVRDTTGARRFWPVEASHVDLPMLISVREQLFAEALHDVDAGDPFYPSIDQQRELFAPVQAQRVIQESLVDALHDWVYHPAAPTYERWLQNGGCFSLAEAATDGLKITAAQLTRDFATRIGRALHQLGCTKIEKRNGMSRFWYKPPPSRKAVTSANLSQPAQQQGVDDDVPF